MTAHVDGQAKADEIDRPMRRPAELLCHGSVVDRIHFPAQLGLEAIGV